MWNEIVLDRGSVGYGVGVEPRSRTVLTVGVASIRPVLADVYETSVAFPESA